MDYEETPRPKSEIKGISDISLSFNEKSYNFSLKRIEDKFKFILTLSSVYPKIYENEYDLSDFQKLNKNFVTYKKIEQIESDLISYIEQKKFRISQCLKNRIILELYLSSNQDNIVNFNLNEQKNNINDNEKFNLLIEELDKKNKEIDELKSKLKEIEIQNNIKDQKILDLEKRLEKLEKNANNESSGNNLIRKINDLEKNFNLKIFKNMNPKLYIHTEKPINEICLFPKSGNYLESSGPSIYDMNHKLIKTFNDIGFCEHICIVKEDLIITSKSKDILLLKIIDIKDNKHQIKKYKNYHKADIKKIIKGFNDNEIITSDAKGNIIFSKFDIKDNNLNLNNLNSIKIDKTEKKAYIFLLKNILVVSSKKLYFYDLNLNNFKNPPSYDITPSCWNSIISINENKRIIGIGCLERTIILDINNINNIKKIKEITIFSDNYAHDALCLYLEKLLMIGTRIGNIYFFDIDNNYELINSIKNAHKIINDASINGILELPNGSFVSYGEDDIIKVW